MSPRPLIEVKGWIRVLPSSEISHTVPEELINEADRQRFQEFLELAEPEGTVEFTAEEIAEQADLNTQSRLTTNEANEFADIVDNDGAGNVIFYIRKKDFDPGMEDDLMGSGVDIVDTNMPLSEADDKDDYGRPHVDPKGSRTFLEPDEMQPHIRFKKMAQKEDKDIGHQDDEPDMLQSTAFETAQYAAKLVKKLQKYDQFDGEVDFPNW